MPLTDLGDPDGDHDLPAAAGGHLDRRDGVDPDGHPLALDGELHLERLTGAIVHPERQPHDVTHGGEGRHRRVDGRPLIDAHFGAGGGGPAARGPGDGLHPIGRERVGELEGEGRRATRERLAGLDVEGGREALADPHAHRGERRRSPGRRVLLVPFEAGVLVERLLGLRGGGRHAEAGERVVACGRRPARATPEPTGAAAIARPATAGAHDALHGEPVHLGIAHGAGDRRLAHRAGHRTAGLLLGRRQAHGVVGPRHLHQRGRAGGQGAEPMHQRVLTGGDGVGRPLVEDAREGIADVVAGSRPAVRPWRRELPLGGLGAEDQRRARGPAEGEGVAPRIDQRLSRQRAQLDQAGEPALRRLAGHRSRRVPVVGVAQSAQRDQEPHELRARDPSTDGVEGETRVGALHHRDGHVLATEVVRADASDLRRVVPEGPTIAALHQQLLELVAIAHPPLHRSLEAHHRLRRAPADQLRAAADRIAQHLRSTAGRPLGGQPPRRRHQRLRPAGAEVPLHERGERRPDEHRVALGRRDQRAVQRGAEPLEAPRALAAVRRQIARHEGDPGLRRRLAELGADLRLVADHVGVLVRLQRQREGVGRSNDHRGRSTDAVGDQAPLVERRRPVDRGHRARSQLDHAADGVGERERSPTAADPGRAQHPIAEERLDEHLAAGAPRPLDGEGDLGAGSGEGLGGPHQERGIGRDRHADLTEGRRVGLDGDLDLHALLARAGRGRGDRSVVARLHGERNGQQTVGVGRPAHGAAHAGPLDGERGALGRRLAAGVGHREEGLGRHARHQPTGLGAREHPPGHPREHEGRPDVQRAMSRVLDPHREGALLQIAGEVGRGGEVEGGRAVVPGAQRLSLDAGRADHHRRAGHRRPRGRGDRDRAAETTAGSDDPIGELHVHEEALDRSPRHLEAEHLLRAGDRIVHAHERSIVALDRALFERDLESGHAAAIRRGPAIDHLVAAAVGDRHVHGAIRDRRSVPLAAQAQPEMRGLPGLVAVAVGERVEDQRRSKLDPLVERPLALPLSDGDSHPRPHERAARHLDVDREAPVPGGAHGLLDDDLFHPVRAIEQLHLHPGATGGAEPREAAHLVGGAGEMVALAVVGEGVADQGQLVAVASLRRSGGGEGQGEGDREDGAHVGPLGRVGPRRARVLGSPPGGEHRSVPVPPETPETPISSSLARAGPLRAFALLSSGAASTAVTSRRGPWRSWTGGPPLGARPRGPSRADPRDRPAPRTPGRR